MNSNLYIGLVHHPIYDKRREVVATAVTNFDIPRYCPVCQDIRSRRVLHYHPFGKPNPVIGKDHPSLGGGRRVGVQPDPEGISFSRPGLADH